jgi:hypothetical protein
VRFPARSSAWFGMSGRLIDENIGRGVAIPASRPHALSTASDLVRGAVASSEDSSRMAALAAMPSTRRCSPHRYWSTSATAAAASSSPASGPPRTSLTTGTTAAPTSSPSSAATATDSPPAPAQVRQARPPTTPGPCCGSWPSRPTPTSHPSHDGCSVPSPCDEVESRVQDGTRSDHRADQFRPEPEQGECGMSGSNVIEQVLYTPEEAAEALRLGRSKVYDSCAPAPSARSRSADRVASRSLPYVSSSTR